MKLAHAKDKRQDNSNHLSKDMRRETKSDAETQRDHPAMVEADEKKQLHSLIGEQQRSTCEDPALFVIIRIHPEIRQEHKVRSSFFWTAA